MNVITRLEYELAYYDSAVHRFNQYTTRTPPSYIRYARFVLFHLNSRNSSGWNGCRGTINDSLTISLDRELHATTWRKDKPVHFRIIFSQLFYLPHLPHHPTPETCRRVFFTNLHHLVFLFITGSLSCKPKATVILFSNSSFVI